MKKVLTTLLVLLFLFFSQHKSVKAEEILFQDDFENGLGKWENIRNNSHLWSVNNGKAQAQVMSGSTVTEIVPLDQYWDDTWKNIEYSFDFTPVSGEDKNFSFKVEDVNNWYEFHFAFNSFELLRAVNGYGVFSLPGTYRFENNQTYNVKITHEDAVVKLHVNDQLIFEGVDPSFNDNGGKIGLKAGTGAVSPTIVQFDNVVVRSLDSTPEPTPEPTPTVPYFSQRDPEWGNDEYDHLSQYSWPTSPTMSAYGCATTSMAMVMNAHGLTLMPDGTPLTPRTLNNWLRDQKDGYVGEGLINWHAATRLSQEIAEAYPGKPKLEYTWMGPDVDFARDSVAQQKPVIFRVPGHFIVGTAYASDTFSINDPYYADRTTLAQAPYNNQFESMRTFQPSQTDLSYITIYSNPELDIAVRDSTVNGDIYSVEEYEEGGLLSQESLAGEQPSQKVISLAKPETGRYIFEIFQEGGGEYNLSVFAYNKLAEPTVYKYQGTMTTQPVIIQLDFDKTGESTITDITPQPEPPVVELADFEDLYRAVVEKYHEGEIRRFSAYVRLKTPTILGHFARRTPLKRHFASMFEHQLYKLKNQDITPTAKLELQELVDQVQERYQ